MLKPCGRSAAAPMITVAIAIRLIWGLSLSHIKAYNALWMCPLIGIILFLPVGFAIKLLSGQPTGCAFNAAFLRDKKLTRYIVAFGISLLLVFDASASMHLLSNTADVMALGEAPVWLLALPLALLIFVCNLLGMEAEGRSSRIWIKIMLPMLAVTAFVQFKNYRPEWLTPLFGGGLKSIFSGGIYSAGCISLLALPWMICVEDTNHSSIIPCAVRGALAASAVLLLLGMLTPSLVKTSHSRTARIEILLGNGRVHLMLQLIMVVLWFANLLHLLNAESTAATAFIRKTMPESRKWIAALLISLAVFVGAISGIAVNGSIASIYGRSLFSAVCIIVLLLAICAMAAERKKNHEKSV